MTYPTWRRLHRHAIHVALEKKSPASPTHSGGLHAYTANLILPFQRNYSAPDSDSGHAPSGLFYNCALMLAKCMYVHIYTSYQKQPQGGAATQNNVCFCLPAIDLTFTLLVLGPEIYAKKQTEVL